MATRDVQRRVRRVLVVSQVLGGIGVGSGISVVGLLAFELSGTEALSGVSATAATLGAAAAAFAIAASTGRGRRPGLVGGYVVGALGALVAVLAAVRGSFPLHVAASVAFGAASAANLQGRYAVTDLAADDRRASELSIVVWATTVGAVLGPNLTGPGARVAAALAIPPLAGPYLFSAAVFVAAALVQWVGLSPDPLLVARARTAEAGGAPSAGRRGSWGRLRTDPVALAALLGMAAAHAVMVGVMVMTPVHLGAHGHDIEVVGLTISLHIAGMYALSPIIGRLTDALGARPMLLAGFVQLAFAGLVAGRTEPGMPSAFTLGLVLLGTGWSFALIAGSALLTEAVAEPERPAAQGVSDLAMNLAGGAAGIASGVTVGLAGFEVMAMGSLVILVVPAWLVAQQLVSGFGGAGGAGVPAAAAPAGPALAAIDPDGGTRR
jgi:MFS family permease